MQRFGYFGTAMIPENTTFLGSKIEGNQSLRISGYQSLLISGEKSTAKFEPPRNQTIDENLYLYSGRTYKNSQVMQNGVCQVQNVSSPINTCDQFMLTIDSRLTDGGSLSFSFLL